MKDAVYQTASKTHHYLWHLAALGVLRIDAKGQIATTLWDEIAATKALTPSTVVMIDVGCAFDHPNLRHRVDAAASVDFTASVAGQRFGAQTTQQVPNASNFDGLQVDDLRLDGLESADQSLFADVVTHLKSTRAQTRTTGNVEAAFASHGTAVAGLVVGGPEIADDPETPPSPGIIPYFGVDPFSRLISVRTGFDDDPLQFIAALLYAHQQSPDVIVMPRGLPDPEAGAVTPKDDFHAELEQWNNREAADLLDRIDSLRASADPVQAHKAHRSLTNRRLWRVVRALFVAISQHTPIVCASGNEGESQLLYPASLATRENGIIAVGAVSGAGFRSGYANYGEGLTLVAPSDDMEVFNRHQLRGTDKNMADHAPQAPTDAQHVPYSEKALLSTDIPGDFGYARGDDPEGAPVQSGYYTQFGGTSGAAALVAGVIALLRRAERSKSPDAAVRDGPDMRALLTETARMTLPGETPTTLQTETMNATGEDAEDPHVFFGAGLIDARAAFERLMR